MGWLQALLTHQLAPLKSHRFARRSEQFEALQISLLDEVIDADIAAIETEQQQIFERADLKIARSTLAQWIGT